MTEENVDKRKLARELQLQAKFYRSTASIFLLVGTLVFLCIYFTKIDGQVLDALRRPVIVIGLIIPFLPAVVLSKLADKAHKKFMKLKESQVPVAAAAPAAPAVAPEDKH